MVVASSGGARMAALAALVAMVGAACSGSASPARAAVPARSSAQALAAVRGAAAATLTETASISIALDGATVFGGSPAAVTGTGAFDFRALRGALTLRPAGAAKVEPVVFAPGGVYVRPAAGTASLPPGKTWIAADLSEAAGPLGATTPSFVLQAESINPALTISELLWGAVSAAEVSQEAVAGAPATRYDVTVDLRTALANASGTAGLPFALALQAEAAALRGAPAPPVRVWLTSDGRLLRMELSPPGAGVGRARTTLSGFGLQVSADPPPGGQVVEFTALSPAGERENRNGGDADGG
ncbi:MAG TPA: hypothetical protein VKF59_02195 [Candidatus Dormibacteraeota bacterium]|nr:hypothetical protein [Candidatus Dormibacteraeota bacterium]